MPLWSEPRMNADDPHNKKNKKPSLFRGDRALLHKLVEAWSFAFLEQTYTAIFVTGMPGAVKPFNGGLPYLDLRDLTVEVARHVALTHSFTQCIFVSARLWRW